MEMVFTKPRHFTKAGFNWLAKKTNKLPRRLKSEGLLIDSICLMAISPKVDIMVTNLILNRS